MGRERLLNDGENHLKNSPSPSRFNRVVHYLYLQSRSFMDSGLKEDADDGETFKVTFSLPHLLFCYLINKEDEKKEEETKMRILPEDENFSLRRKEDQNPKNC